MSEQNSVATARTAAEALALAAPGAPASLLPGNGLYDVAQTPDGPAKLSAIAPLPQQAAPWVRPLAKISGPEHLPAAIILTSQEDRQIHIETQSPFGYDFHWIREVATSVLRGTTGLRIDASTSAHLSADITGRFLAVVLRDDVNGEPWLRLVLSSSSGRELSATTRAAVSAKADIPLPNSPDELLRAILGVHPLQWARDAISEIGSVRWKRIAENCGATTRHLEALMDAWQSLGVRTEAALWHAISSESAFQQLRAWTQWIASPDTSEPALIQRIRETLDADPTFAASPAARWLEAVSGAALSSISSSHSFQTVRNGAVLVENLAGQPALERLMRKLPLKSLRELSLNELWPWARKRFEEILGEVPTRDNFADKTSNWAALRDRAYASARQTLSQKLTSEISVLLSAASGDDVLADISFPMTADGLALFRQVLSGDLTPVFYKTKLNLRLRQGLLTHHIRRTRHIELHLPFMDRRAWQYERSAVAQAEVVPDESGRLLAAYSAQASDATTRLNRCHSVLVFSAALSARDGEAIHDNYTLNFSDTRTVQAGGDNAAWLMLLDAYGIDTPALPPQPCTAALSVSVPGRLVESWTTAPHSRDENFFPTMCRVSRAVQSTMRRWIPALYLASIEQYRTPSVVHPLLAWQCSQPYTGIKKGSFCWDFMDDQAIERALASSARTLSPVLASIQRLLLNAGKKEAATYYDPADTRFILASVQRQRRNFAALLAADSYFIEELVRLADCGRELRSLAQVRPEIAVRNLTRYSATLVRAFHRRLTRLYAKEDFVALGSLLLVDATAALADRPDEPSSLAATLTLDSGGTARVYHNAAARLLA